MAMRSFTASDPGDYQTRFLEAMGMSLTHDGGFTELWENPDVGSFYRAGCIERIQCTFGAYTMPDDIDARCTGSLDLLHAGIIYQGAHYAEMDESDGSERPPTPFVCIERGRGSRVVWERGQRIRGVEVSIDRGYLERDLAPFLGLDGRALSKLRDGAIYTKLPDGCIAPLRELERAFGEGSISPALATSIAGWFLARLVQACEKGAISAGANPSAARFIVGNREVVLSPDEIRRVERAHEIVLTEATEFPTSAILAKRVGLGEQKLKAGFSLLYHQTIWDCGNEQRMERAERLLREGDMRVSDISSAMGYRSPSSFIEKFRAWSGATPHQYRLRVRRAGDGRAR